MMHALTELIKSDMKPALGVTEPGAIAFAVSDVYKRQMLAIASHSRDEALNRLNQEYTITDEGKPRHIKFESMPVGEAEQAVGMYLRYNAMAQYEESEKLLSADQTKNVPFDVMKADFENGIYPLDVLVHGFKTLSEEEYGEEKSLYDNQATLLGYTSYKVVQVSLDEQWRCV